MGVLKDALNFYKGHFGKYALGLFNDCEARRGRTDFSLTFLELARDFDDDGR